MQRNMLICVILTATLVVVYGRVAGFEFDALNDPLRISQGVHMGEGFTLEGVAGAFSMEQLDYWRPLALLSHMLDGALYGVRPGGHHITNCLWHLLNTLVLFGLLHSMTRAPWRSGLVAALFSLHPLHVESVAWVAERKDLLSASFGFLAICAYVHYTRRGGVARYGLIAVLLTLGLMAKPMLVPLPFVLLLLDYWPLRRWSTTGSFVRALVEKLPLFPIILIISGLALLAQKDKVNFASQFVPVSDRAINGLVSYVQYVGKVFMPRGLAVVSPHPNLPGGTPWTTWHVVAAVALLLAFTVLVIRYRHHRFLPVGWFWYVGTLVPVSGLVPVGDQAMADRFTYVPLIGVFIIMAWGAELVVGKRRLEDDGAPDWIVIGVALVLVACAAASWRQLGFWRNSFEIYRHAFYVHPTSATAHHNLALIYRFGGVDEKAYHHFSKAVQISKSNAVILVAFGNELAAKGRLDEAVNHYRRAIEIKPEYAGAHNNLGNALRLLGDLDQAIEQLRRAIAINNDHYGARHNQGLTFAAKGDHEAAIHHYEKALAIRPNHPILHVDLGISQRSDGRFGEAITSFRRALELKPGMETALEQLNMALDG